MSQFAFDHDDVLAAADRLRGVAHRTPVMTSRSVDERTGAQVFFKCENLQRTGSFKFRGACNAIMQFTPAQKRAGVLTYSSGNHAQGIALAAKLHGIPATIVMPSDAPASKLAATRGYGAEVILYDRATESREEIGARLQRERGSVLVPPYDHPHVAAGQGTMALELLEEVGKLDVILAAIGGGGMISGCAVAVRGMSPTTRVIAVEPSIADDAYRSLKSGTLQSVANPPTVADGVRTPSLGAITFPILREMLDDIVTVSEESIMRATLFLIERLRMMVEPTAGLPFAPLLDGSLKLEGKRVGVILCGGNVDIATLAEFERKLQQN